MGNVAINGTQISQTTKYNYITYEYRVWDDCRYTGYDEEGNPYCIGGWLYYTGYSNAIINGYVNCHNNVYVNGVSIATAGDKILETWKNSGIHSDYVSGSASPALDDSGIGGINMEANSKSVYINNKLVAIQNSNVTTHLNTLAKLTSPVANNIFIG